MFKIIATTKPPKTFYRIGEDFNTSLWYDFSKVQDVGAKTGDLVEIEFDKEGKDRVLTSIKVTGSAPAKAESTGGSWKGGTDKGVDINNSIRKQAVGKMVAETMKAIDLSTYSEDDILALIPKIFNKYDEVTK